VEGTPAWVRQVASLAPGQLQFGSERFTPLPAIRRQGTLRVLHGR
jgi:hypothetical protein